jgi:hypothetical protein
MRPSGADGRTGWIGIAAANCLRTDKKAEFTTRGAVVKIGWNGDYNFGWIRMLDSFHGDLPRFVS